jgi:tRNA-splicing endonuclease subunit Sen54
VYNWYSSARSTDYIPLQNPQLTLILRLIGLPSQSQSTTICYSHCHCNLARSAKLPPIEMAFDDDENAVPRPSDPAQAREDAAAAAEEALEDEMPDFRHFAALINKKGKGSQAIRKGGKDFESHGTRAQENVLEESRQAMEGILHYTRIHKEDTWIRCWYFPEWWAEEDEKLDVAEARLQKTSPPTTAIYRRERVVVMEKHRGKHSIIQGRVIPGVGREMPAKSKLWLLPEEALYLVERGTIDLWYPAKDISELVPGLPALEGSEAGPEVDQDDVPESKVEATVSQKMEEYEDGVPLSLEGAYSLLVGHDGERGKIFLPKYQVYSHLKRAGYHVLRAPHTTACPEANRFPQQTKTIWQWLFSLISPKGPFIQQPYGPLVQPGFYRKYSLIYPQLDLIQRHKPAAKPVRVREPEDPFKVFYHVWKKDFSVHEHPPPDFRVCVVDARETSVPSLDQISVLLDSCAYDPPDTSLKGRGALYRRLKHGHRSVIIAVVDCGLVNFMRFGDGAFSEEPIWAEFDNKGRGTRGNKGAPRGGGRGGRGGKRGGRRSGSSG